MNPQISLVVAAIACGLSAVCVVLSLWSIVRLASLESRYRDVETKLPAKRASELEQGFDSLLAAFEALQQKNLEFKQSIHNSVQRLDQVMRRNEKAAAALIDEDGNLRREDLPDFVPARAPGTNAVDAIAENKQAALRARYRANRGLS